VVDLEQGTEENIWT